MEHMHGWRFGDVGQFALVDKRWVDGCCADRYARVSRLQRSTPLLSLETKIRSSSVRICLWLQIDLPCGTVGTCNVRADCVVLWSVLSFYTGLCGTVDLFDNCPADPSAYLLENEPINDCESLAVEETLMEPSMEPVTESLDDLSE